MRIVVLMGIAAAGCGTVSEKDVDAAVAGDVATDTSTIDAAPPRCNPNAAFGAATELTTLDTASDDEAPFLTPDELTLYFGSNRAGGAGGYDVYRATRAAVTAPFGNVTLVTGVNTTGDERVPRISSDELTLIAANKPIGSTLLRVGLSLRTSTAVAFPALQSIANVAGTTNDTEPTMLPSGNVIYFASDRGGNYDLYRTSKSGGAFSAPVLVAGAQLNTASTESSPAVTPDELHLYILSNRAGVQGVYDIYASSRATTADAFSAPVSVTELNTTSIDFPSWISPDNCVLYFTRAITNRGYDMFFATRGN
jgi:Tol biopolymer transport system component